MKYLIILALHLFPIVGFSQYSLNRSFIHDEMGSFQFYNEIVTILKQAKKKHIQNIEFNILEARMTNESTSKREFEKTILKCKYTSDSTLMVFKNYKYGNLCYSWGYMFLIKYNIFILDDVFTISESDEKKYGCKDTHKRYANFERETYSIESIEDTTIFTVRSIFYKVNNEDTLTMNDYLMYEIYKINPENKIIERTCSGCSDLIISYPSRDTTILKYVPEDGFVATYKISESREAKSDTELVVIEHAVVKKQ